MVRRIRIETASIMCQVLLLHHDGLQHRKLFFRTICLCWNGQPGDLSTVKIVLFCPCYTVIQNSNYTQIIVSYILVTWRYLSKRFKLKIVLGKTAKFHSDFAIQGNASPPSRRLIDCKT